MIDKETMMMNSPYRVRVVDFNPIIPTKGMARIPAMTTLQAEMQLLHFRL